MALNNSELANYWMHSGMIDVDGIKMSKSLGNFIKAKDILARVEPMVLRWFLLGTHYRSDVNVSDEIINGARVELNKVFTSLKQALLKLALADYQSTERDEESYQRFIAAMEDDLNTPNAYAVVFEIVKAINQKVRAREIDYADLAKTVNALTSCLDVLGIDYPRIKLSGDDRELFARWNEAKAAKDFAKADEYRQQLTERGLL